MTTKLEDGSLAAFVRDATEQGLDYPVVGNDRQIDDLAARKRLWLAHHQSRPGALYGDDGKMDCNACLLDFHHDPWPVLVERSVRLMVRDWRHDLADREAQLAEARRERDEVLAECRTRGIELKHREEIYISAVEGRQAMRAALIVARGEKDAAEATLRAVGELRDTELNKQRVRHGCNCHDKLDALLTKGAPR